MQPEETLRLAFPDRDTPKITHGLPFATAVAKYAHSTFGAKSIYVLCSATLASTTPYLTDLLDALGPDAVAGVRRGMTPHTLWSEVLEVVREARPLDLDLIVTLGGGSLTDAAKMVSLALANGVSEAEDLASLARDGPAPRPEPDMHPAQIPVVAVPTTLSGGEYSAFAGATEDGTGRKWSFAGHFARGPSLVVLDPALCAAAVPARLWLGSGVRALDHCVETLCSPRCDEAAAADARRALASLVPGLRRCRDDPKGHDVEARLLCQLAVVDAMAACSRGVPLGASHGIGHQLGPLGVAHGETSCVLLPAVCRFNASRGANNARQAEARKAMGLEGDGELGDLLDDYIRGLGLPRTLREVGVEEKQLEGIAEHSLTDRWVKTNPAPLEKADVLEILRTCLG